jgi:hypothetical protein
MQGYDNNLLSFRDFCIESDKKRSVIALNLDIKSNCDVLIYSRKNDISRIAGIFTFNIFNNIKFSGKLIHNGTDIIYLINNIKKFRINGKRIGMVARLIEDIFTLPANPSELFDPNLTISEQVLGFIPYSTRIEIMNGIIRREMIKLTEIREIIKEFDAAGDKKAYTLRKSMDYGILNIYQNIYDILNSSSENREDLMVSSIIGEKKGIDLADIVVLRNYYRYRMKYSHLMGDIFSNSINGKDSSGIYKELRNVKKDTKENFDFTGFKLTRPYSEGILKNEIMDILKNYMEVVGIPLDPHSFERIPGDSNISDIYKILACIAFLTEKKIMVIDLSDHPSLPMDIIEYIKRFKFLQNMACLYICTSEDMVENGDKIFDRVVYV